MNDLLKHLEILNVVSRSPLNIVKSLPPAFLKFANDKTMYSFHLKTQCHPQKWERKTHTYLMKFWLHESVK